MYRRIHIMGASGAGTTTLGKALAARLPHVNLDSDDYFWEQKYTKQSVVAERLNKLQADMAQNEPWILSGAVCGWGIRCVIPLTWWFSYGFLSRFVWNVCGRGSMNDTVMRVCRAEINIRMYKSLWLGRHCMIRQDRRSAAGRFMRNGWPG